MKTFYKKNWLYNLSLVAMLCGAVFFSNAASAVPMTGTYTIDAGSAASATNFTTITAAVTALKTDGVSGAVTLNVVAGSGPYTESLEITAISGASATNTITFNGNGETISYDTDATPRSVVQFDGADYITIDNFVLEATGTSYSRNVHFWKGADYNTVKNCEMINKSYTGTGSHSAYVSFTNSETSRFSSGNHGSFNTVDNNNMYSTNGSGKVYSGYYDYRSSSYYGSTIGNVFSNNNVKHVYYYGTYIYYNNGMQVLNNDFSEDRSASTYYTVYHYRWNTGTIQNKINGNNIHDMSATSRLYVYMGYYVNGTASMMAEANNNTIASLSSGTTYIYNRYNNYFQFDGNTINKCSSTSGSFYNYFDRCNNSAYTNNEVSGNSAYYTNYGLYAWYADNCDISENHYHDNVTDAGYNWGYNYGMYVYYARNGTQVDNNLFHDNGGSYGNYDILAYYPTESDFTHNTIYVNNSCNFGYALFVYDYNGSPYGSGVDVANNQVYLEETTGTVYGWYCASTTSYNTFDYNNFYVSSGFTGAQSYYNDGSFYATPAAMIQGGDFDATFSIDPEFKDAPNGDFEPQSIALSNKGLVGMEAEDMNGVTRTACGPDLGAIEYKVDLEAVSYGFTGTNECGGYTEDLDFTIKNGASADLTDVEVAYTINGGGEVVEIIAGPITPGSSYTHTFAKSPVFNKPGTNLLEVYLNCDDDASNNKLSHSIDITPSPYGADMFAGTTFEGYYRSGAGGGSEANPDVTTNGYDISYEITAPAAYNNAGYGTDWSLTSVTMTTNGAAVTSGLSLTAPGTGNALVEFDPDASLAGETVYIAYSISDLNTGCDSIIGRYVYIPHVPVADWEVADVCDGDVAQFKNLTTMGGTAIANYNWKMNDAMADEDEYELIDPLHAFSTFGVYTVDMEAWNSVYPKFVYSKSGSITVTPVPTIAFKVLNACEGSDIEFKNTTTLPIAGSITYDWNFGDGATSTDKEPKHQYASAGGYIVRLTATANGCASVLEKNANQFAVPVADFDMAGKCDNEEIMFTNNTTIAIGNSGYNWDFNDGDISNFENPTHLFDGPGMKTIKLRAVSEFGCTHEVTKSITLEEAPMADFTFTTPCNLTATEFTSGGTEPGGSITTVLMWDINGETTTADANTSWLFSEVGPKTITLTKTSTNGCVDMISKEINVLLQPNASFDATDVCEGEAVVFKNTSSVAAGEINYEWNFGTGITSNETSPSVVLPLDAEGKTASYNVKLEASVDGGCASTATKTVTVNAAPDAGFAIARSGRVVTLTPNATGESLYQWRFGDGSRSSMEAPVYEYENVDEGTFTICLAVQNAAECWDESCSEVSLNLSDIEGLALNNDMVNVYPNPTKNDFTVAVTNVKKDVKIVMVDLLGSVVFELNQADMSGTYKVSTDGLANGVYIMQVINGDSYATKKVTLNR